MMTSTPGPHPPSLPAHGGQLRSIARQFHVREDTLIDFSASISPYPPPQQVLTRLLRKAADAKFLSAYPDLDYEDLKAAISIYAGVPSEAVCVGNGVMPILDAVLRALDIRRCLVVQPCFGGYARSLGASRTEAVAFPLQPEQGFALPLDPLLCSLVEHRCDAVLLANPHSPSGIAAAPELLRSLCRQAAALKVRVLLDEAFIDYEPESSLCFFAASRPGTIVFRSLTKFFAIPALRVAYAVTNPEAVETIGRCVAEWPIGSLASAAAIELLACEGDHRSVRENNAREREALLHSLQKLGIAAYPSRANYLLIRLRSDAAGLALWRSLIVEHGIVSRCCRNFEGLDARYLRFSIRTREDNDRLLHGLQFSLRGASEFA
ncbi:MAG TPA: aminotransferase class I/II-fold pyridoxal phosphate-dependent enzyme [Acidobacteriaceae bacterium]|nr:aminotransferase class I/II-fold pyridoxal phosphate-dependent enzyme [Acidobacteriaceae bacterium]